MEEQLHGGGGNNNNDGVGAAVSPLAESASMFKADFGEQRRAQHIWDAGIRTSEQSQSAAVATAAAASSGASAAAAGAAATAPNVVVDGDGMEKWRAIQAWASVDSVEAASQGRPAGSFQDDASDVSSMLPQQHQRHVRASLPALPESLSPLTQVAEPPVHVAMAAMQPALTQQQQQREMDRERRVDSWLGGGAAVPATPGYEAIDDDNSTASELPAWATPAHANAHARVVAKAASGAHAEGGGGMEMVLPTTATTAITAAVPFASSSSAFRPHSELELELEVQKRREREARGAVDKIDHAMRKLRSERDDVGMCTLNPPGCFIA